MKVASFYVLPPATRAPLREGRAYIETLCILPAHVLQWVPRWLRAEYGADVDDVIQNVFIYLWHAGRDLPADRTTAVKVLAGYTRRRLWQRSRVMNWARARMRVESLDGLAVDAGVLSRIEIAEYIAEIGKRTREPQHAELWAHVLSGGATLEEIVSARIATTRSSAMRARTDILSRLREFTGSTSTETRIASVTVDDATLADLATAHEGNVIAIGKVTGMSTRNLYKRLQRLGWTYDGARGKSKPIPPQTGEHSTHGP